MVIVLVQIYCAEVQRKHIRCPVGSIYSIWQHYNIISIHMFFLLGYNQLKIRIVVLVV